MTTIDDTTPFADIIGVKGDIVAQKEALRAELKILNAEESEIDFLLMKKMDADGVTLTKNGTARVSITESLKPKCDDWEVFKKHVIDTDGWDLLNRAFNARAYQDTIELGEEVPGLSSYTLRKIGYGKA